MDCWTAAEPWRTSEHGHPRPSPSAHRMGEDFPNDFAHCAHERGSVVLLPLRYLSRLAGAGGEGRGEEAGVSLLPHSSW